MNIDLPRSAPAKRVVLCSHQAICLSIKLIRPRICHAHLASVENEDIFFSMLFYATKHNFSKNCD